MRKYSFNEKKNLLIPVNANMRPPLDANGRQIGGDELIKQFGKIITKFEEKNNRPVPIEDQTFIAWVKQACKMLDEGKTSDEIFNKTLVKTGV